MLELLGVSKRRGDRVVLRDVALSIGPGEVVLVTGSTGAGATTLCRLLTAEDRPDAGSIRVFGHDLARLRPRSVGLLRRQIGVVPQDLRLLGGRGAIDNVALALEVKGVPRRHARARATDVLADVGFRGGPRLPVARLSRGEQQLVALARALVREPQLLILDQPTAHLDGAGAAALVALLAGRTALLATTDGELLAAAGYQGWRVLELRDGALRELADAAAPAVVVDEPTAPYAMDPPADEAIEDADIEEEIANVVPFPSINVRAGGTE